MNAWGYISNWGPLVFAAAVSVFILIDTRRMNKRSKQIDIALKSRDALSIDQGNKIVDPVARMKIYSSMKQEAESCLAALVKAQILKKQLTDSKQADQLLPQFFKQEWKLIESMLRDSPIESAFVLYACTTAMMRARTEGEKVLEKLAGISEHEVHTVGELLGTPSRKKTFLQKLKTRCSKILSPFHP